DIDKAIFHERIKVAEGIRPRLHRELLPVLLEDAQILARRGPEARRHPGALSKGQDIDLLYPGRSLKKAGGRFRPPIEDLAVPHQPLGKKAFVAQGLERGKLGLRGGANVRGSVLKKMGRNAGDVLFVSSPDPQAPVGLFLLGKEILV